MTEEGHTKDGHKAIRASITGRVQGVCYRAWTVQEAQRLGLTGWVRNRPDGSVEALFAGPGEAVDRMLQKCRQGPPMALVEDIRTDRAEDPGHLQFRQIG